MSSKPRIIIGSSQEAFDAGIASALLANLKQWAYPELWNQGMFGYGDTNIESLEQNLPKFDAAVFIFNDDDFLKIRNVETKGVRDNVLFEFGLAMGALGRKKTFFLLPTEPKIRIPTDISGMVAGMYDPNAPTLEAELHSCSENIKKKVLSDKQDAIDLSKNPHVILDFLFHQAGAPLFSKIEAHLRKILSKGLIRTDWSIDLEYDLSSVAEGVINETITWHYNLVNITNEKILTDISLSYFNDDRNTLISYTIDGPNLEEISLMDKDSVISENGLFKTIKKDVSLEAGEAYFVYLIFINTHSVSLDTHRIHNCFAPRELTTSLAMKCQIPKGYVMDVLGIRRVNPHNYKNKFDFIIREPLLPEQVIEYTFEKIPN